MVLERGEVTLTELLTQLVASFPELDAAGVRTCIDHLLAQADLACPEPGLLQIGPKAQAAHERSHYRDLLVTFTGPDLLVGKHGTAEVGYLDPAVLVGKRDEPLKVLLSGRSWSVREVDWKRRVVWLEPATQGGKARWMGSGRGMSAEVAMAVRELLLSGEAGVAKLSKRAIATLDELRDTTPTHIDPPAVQQHGPANWCMWTYAGSDANQRTQLAWRHAGASSSNGLTVTWRVDPRLLGNLSDLAPVLSIEEIAELAQPFKFAELLPAEQRRSLILSRLALAPAKLEDASA
jgi:ATP-dependent Lhr-like helicase